MWKKTVEMCQAEVDRAKGHVLLTPRLFFWPSLLTALCSKLILQKGPRPPLAIPDSIMPSEVTVEDVASTSLPVDRDQCCPIFTPPLKKQCPLGAKFASLRTIWII